MAQGMVVIPSKDFTSDINTLTDRTNKLMVNSLITNLWTALSSSNIDAWCDSFTDNSMIDTVSSTNYTIDAAQLSATQNFSNSGGSATYQMGLKDHADRQKVGFKFQTYANTRIYKASATITKVGGGAGEISCHIYSSDLSTIIASSTNTIPAGAFGVEASSKTFYFDNANVESELFYWLVFEATGVVSATNHFSISTSANTGNQTAYHDGTTWTTYAHKGYYQISGASDAEIYWDPVSVSTPLSHIGVSIDATPGVGEVKVWISSDGVTWIEAEYNTAIPLSVPTTLYLKAKITKDAKLSGISWGGL